VRYPKKISMQDSTASSSQGMAHNPRLAEFVLALGGFGIGTSEFVIMGLVNRVAGDLAVTVPQVGYAISSYALGVVVGAPLISALAARAPRRLLLIVLMLVFAVSNTASAMGPGFWSLVGLRFLAGLPLHIPAHHEHPFRANVNTDSGST